ncbi:hypothetical protein pipiens_004494 [Culex pipiens pipiens]|uniref:Uncharacterized protein n=1 Tax=Culex pipiens pipiens TaxID=38569 RepID=A0ABD1CJ60_CULPP
MGWLPRKKPVLDSEVKSVTREPAAAHFFAVLGPERSSWYSLSDDQFRYERGYFKKKSDSDEMVWTVHGRYRFRSPEGELYSYKYSAGEEGFNQQVVSSREDPLDVVNRIDPKALASLVG